jgi:hypothetical protein
MARKTGGINMNTKTLAKLLAFSGAAMCLGVMPGLADAGRCRHVGGGILTNFLDQNTCGPPTGLCSDGTATGDLRGAIGVNVLAVTPQKNGTTVYHVHHHLVTETGDTVLFDDADLTAFPISNPEFVVADYVKPIIITGGTGGFEGATGKVSVFGAIDLNKGQLTLRYEGTVCFEPVSPP